MPMIDVYAVAGSGRVSNSALAAPSGSSTIAQNKQLLLSIRNWPMAPRR